ncbi:hypothetical protein [Flavobacterium sp. 5]|uniref:hypothetical protein n=1 Tax=Flavobacterium sp. 5 TaxID=2035199 RepID=UPI000C2CDD92|nr:hypothetical protein [Flavobacterium sp. 5]PKB18887.1 hypothetical protein CLU82_4184 [Flavobacterium sp. 5]
MDAKINNYQKQYKNALKTIEKLQEVKADIDLKLKDNPVCSYLHKDLRGVNLDITITQNEIEHIESYLHEYNN